MESEDKFLKQLERGAGLDIHKDKINVCIMTQDKTRKQEEYGTKTEDLRKIKDRLVEESIKECAMESTGVYWYGIYHELTEAGIKVTLVNPRQSKQIPGRKTDENDSQWICKLLIHGLLKASYIPEEGQQKLRDLTRQRSRYVQLRTRSLNQIMKVLEKCNIKISSVFSNISIKSSMSIIRAISEGIDDVSYLLSLCKGQTKKKLPQIEKALEGRLTQHHREMLRMLLKDYDHYQEQIKELGSKIDEVVCEDEEKKAAVEKLDSVRGIGLEGARVVVAELGADMSRFENSDQCASWGGFAPGNNESAGKKKNTRMRAGNKYLKVILVQIAWSMVRQSGGYWWGVYNELKRKMPKKKAICAVARKILKLIYKLLSQKDYQYGEWSAEQYYMKRKLRLKPVKA
jgi:transposase